MSRELDVDVLVVGAGMAALQAAISARQAGVRVGIATRGHLGRGGSSVMTTGGYAAAFTDNDDDPTIHFADTMAGGGDIADPGLVRLLCDEASERVGELRRIGGQFATLGADLVFTGNGDHSRPRNLAAATGSGTAYTVPMAEYARAMGVVPVESTMIVDLIRHDGDVLGAVGVEQLSDRIAVISARTVILATGGCGQMFPLTSNPNDVTGDGFSLASRAGATLRDMEFIQFYPWRCVDPFIKSRVAVQPRTFTVGGRLYNAAGERFMTGYDPVKAEAATRDVAARAIYQQIQRGLGVGGGVRLDLSALSDETMAAVNPRIVRGLRRTGIDHRTYPFVVAPEAHYFMGGLVIDSDGRSTLPSLFAAGEVAGGIQGGNRLTNNALPEALVFGARAGHAAAAQAAGRPHRSVGDLAAPALATVREIVARPPGTELRRRDVQAVVWGALGIVRTGAAMSLGLDRLAGLRNTLRRVGAAGAGGLTEWYALRSMLDTAELALTSGLLREESRGAHYREDFPTRDDERWRRPIFSRATGDLHVMASAGAA